MKLYTLTWLYGATCEGETLIAYVSYGEDEEDFRDKFIKRYGKPAVAEWILKGATIVEGFDAGNEIVQYLAPKKLLKDIDHAHNRAQIEWFAESHFNYS